MPDAPRATRHAYRDRLVSLLPGHSRLVCLDTDTGLFDGDLGSRYVNIGIAEHNLMGMAAGLAASGFVPYVNTMATFAATRALEAVKLDIAYPALPVRIMATHGGLAAGHLGPTHQALEDLAVMRALPNMTVVVPADAAATEAVVEQSVDLPGPLYVRLGRKATPPIGADPPVIGTAQVLRTGTGPLLVCCGPHPVLACLGGADELDATVLNMHTVKPLDTATLLRYAAGTDMVVTVEEHWRSGGLGGAVTEALAETAPVRVVRVGVPDEFVGAAGGHDALIERYRITAAGIVHRLRPSGASTGTDPSTRED